MTARIPPCTPALSAALLAAASVHAGAPIVLNEIYADPEPSILGDANGDGVRDGIDDEFLEFVNISGGVLDISGWTVEDGTAERHVFPAGTMLDDGCGVVLFGGGLPLGPAAFGGMQVQVASTGALFLNNGGDTVTVRNAATSVILIVPYGLEASNDASITLNPDVTGLLYQQHDAIPESNGALYSAGTRLDGTLFSGCSVGTDTDGDGFDDGDDNCPMDFNPDQSDCDGDGVGDACETDPDTNGNGIPDLCEVVVINEVLADPAPDPDGDANQDLTTDGGDDEFVEFVNTGTLAINLSGWTISDMGGVRHEFPIGTVVEPGCAVVVFGGGNPPINNFGGAVVQTASGGFLGLNNDGDTVTISDLIGRDFATLVYGMEGANDVSLNLDPELTGSTYVAHDTVSGAAGALFSPGTFVDGTAFGSCVPPGPDMDGDGHPNDVDNCVDIFNPDQADCNFNDIGDVCDIDSGFSFDCNLNGIPDECEPDCNGNFVPDDCDITDETSDDCDGNGVPDECQFDCDNSGTADACQILAMPALDSNGDGILDSCQVIVDITINEILADPAPDSPGDANGDGTRDAFDDEFIELVNFSAGSLDISGWTLSDESGLRHVFPAGTVLEADCGIVVFGGGSPLGEAAFGGMVVQVASSGGLGLNNDGDTIVLSNSVAVLVTLVMYDDLANNDASITRNPDITGAFERHDLVGAANGAIFSPGLQLDGTLFGGCPNLNDTDRDGIPNEDDNCPDNFNPNQEDCDDDGLGDACETDPDKNGNGIPDLCEVVPPENLVINEIRIDMPGTDNDEYFELRGDPGTLLDGLTYIVIGDGLGGSGVIEHVLDLDGYAIQADGLFLAAEETFSLPGTVDALLEPNVNGGGGGLDFENGDNVTHVLVANFSGALDDDLDTDDDGVLDVVPWTDVVDLIALIEEENPPAGTEYHYGPPTVGPDGPFVPGQAYRCDPDDTWTIGFFVPDPASDTPDATNPQCDGGMACLGDFDRSGAVGTVDLLLLLGQWGTAGPEADLDNSGSVDTVDLLMLLGAWGPCPG